MKKIPTTLTSLVSLHVQAASLVTFPILFPIMVICSLTIVYTNLFKACHSSGGHVLSPDSYMV